MFNSFSRRKFLSSAAALGVVATGAQSRAACSDPSQGQGCESGQGNKLLGHKVVGSGPEGVVILHQWLGDHSNFDGVSNFLSKDKGTYVLADLRGYGLSRHMTGTYTMAEAAEDVLALMAKLGHTRFHVVGHSMSGQIAQYMAWKYPERVKSVVCISPVPASGFKTDAAGFDKLRKVITDPVAFADVVKVRTSSRYGQVFVDWMRAVATQATADAMVGYLTMFTSTDFSVEAQNLSVPAVLITGDKDIKFYKMGPYPDDPKYPGLLPQLKKVFANLQPVTITDAGHYSMLETPILLGSLVEKAILGQPLPQLAHAGSAGLGRSA